jgi:hypothetical protein
MHKVGCASKGSGTVNAAQTISSRSPPHMCKTGRQYCGPHHLSSIKISLVSAAPEPSSPKVVFSAVRHRFSCLHHWRYPCPRLRACSTAGCHSSVARRRRRIGSCLPSSSSFTTVRIWSLATMMTPVRLLLLHLGPAPLLPWSGDGGARPREMGEAVWGEMGAVARGRQGLQLITVDASPPHHGCPRPCRRRPSNPRCLSPLATRPHGRRENTPIYGSPGVSVDDAHAHPTAAGGHNSGFWCDFSHVGDD